MKEYTFDTDRSLPLVIEAEVAGGAAPSSELLCAWIKEHEAEVESKLLQYGAILFRGFNVNAPAAFRRFVNSVASGLMDYVDGNSPRTKLTSGVYTSTEYPAQYFISLHNELSYSHRWPGRLFFCCIVAPQENGETVIADSRAILNSLPADLVEEFDRRKVKYIRNLHGGDGFGPSWQDTFETPDRETVESYCRDSGMSFEWRPDGGLRVTQVRPATASHPRSGERIWFNQADQFHPSTHPPEVYESLMSLYRGDQGALPQNVSFGDDTPIDVSMLDEIRAVTQRQTVYFPWREGDVLMVDNMLVAHGRAPFSGPRKILVSMCDSRGGEI
jgi:alpha-ketoglutarate-dependent taurine dioxygenase